MAASLLILGSCSENEEFSSQNAGGKDIIYAKVETDAATRMAIGEKDADGKRTLSWEKGDKFVLFSTASSSKYECTGVSEGVGTFQGTSVSSAVGAVYPASLFEKYGTIGTGTKNYIAINLPATIDGTAENITPVIPMKAAAPSSSSTSNSYTFKHLCAMLTVDCTTLNNDGNYTKLVFTASNKQISGTIYAFASGIYLYSLDASTGEEIASDAIAEADKKITITLPAKSGNVGKVFYVPLPPNTYGTLTATLEDENGSNTKTLKTWTNLKLERAKIYNTSLGTTVVSGGIEAANTALEAVTESSKSMNLQVSDAVTTTSENSTITVPAVEGSLVKVTFANAPTTSETPLTIESNTSAAVAESASDLTVTMPSTQSGGEVNLVVNTPTTTTTLANSDNGETVYGTVTATTATNTLVVGKGITIKKLVVKGGNIRVCDGGKVESIERSSDNTSNVIIYKEEGNSTLPTTITAENIYVSDEELLNKSKTGGEYTLKYNIGLTDVLKVNSTLTIDLNGHSIVALEDFSSKIKWSVISLSSSKSNLTIKDSSTDGSGKVKATGGLYAVSMQHSKAVLTIDGGNFIGGCDHSVYVYKGKATINGGKFSIQTNEDYTGDKANEYVINCYDSSYTAGTASVSITGGSFVGFNPSNCYAEGAGTNFCADGYTAEEDGTENGLTVYTVKKKETTSTSAEE